MLTNMPAAGIKIATPNTNNKKAASAVYECDVQNNTKTTTKENGDITLLVENGAESSFCSLTSTKKQLSSPCLVNDDDDLQKQRNKVPLQNSHHTQLPYNERENPQIPAAMVASNGDDIIEDITKSFHKQIDVDNNTASAQLSSGLGLLQQTAGASSPPPHSYRHSRAYRHFKNPPQPHMCIRTTTEAGEELFINVLSWTRIVIPQEPSDPIPLYGGMRVPPGNPRSPPIVFAVMANPEVLKDSGRHSKDPEERRAMVELMCDFVEAMNPGVKLVRNAIILKDRDISGELKDVWNAVQAQRDREREEQLLLQRQQHQQHFHNLSNTSTNVSSNANSIQTTNNSNTATTTQQMFPKTIHPATIGGEAVVMMASDGSGGGTPSRNKQFIHEVQKDNNDVEIVDCVDSMTRTNNRQMSLALLTENLDSKPSLGGGGSDGGSQSEKKCVQQINNQNPLTNDALSNGNNSKDLLQLQVSGNKKELNNQLNVINCNKDQTTLLTNGSTINSNDTTVSNKAKKSLNATSTPNTIITIPAQTSTPQTLTTATAPPAQQAPAKKEKLGGFLPNGCIFPRFTKNNKHKDKDKDKEKEKETKSKDKEKNVLLSALKKSKDKKSNTAAAATALNQDEKNTSSNSNNTTANNCNLTNNKQQKNCLQQLECGVQKLDLNNHQQQHPTHNIIDNNINNSATSSASASSSITNNTSATSSSSSTTAGGVVGVH